MTTINTNVQSLNAQRNLSASAGSLSTSMQRLSSGLRVNSAKDDAAGLAIAERMNAQVKGMNVAIRNANDGISLAQTAEGALGKMGDSLQRMRELAVQSANATMSGSDRTSLATEFSQLQEEITRLVEGTKFNGSNLFTSAASMVFQVGAGTTDEDKISVTRSQLSGGTAATSGSLVPNDVVAALPADSVTASTAAAAIATVTGNSDIGTSAEAAVNAMRDIDVAIDRISSERANYGAVQNRFDAVISNLQISSENTAAARGRIMDADFAVETSSLSRGQILQQAGTAMVAQANQLPQGVLSLLR